MVFAVLINDGPFINVKKRGLTYSIKLRLNVSFFLEPNLIITESSLVYKLLKHIDYEVLWLCVKLVNYKVKKISRKKKKSYQNNSAQENLSDFTDINLCC